MFVSSPGFLVSLVFVWFTFRRIFSKIAKLKLRTVRVVLLKSRFFPFLTFGLIYSDVTSMGLNGGEDRRSDVGNYHNYERRLYVMVWREIVNTT